MTEKIHNQFLSMKSALPEGKYESEEKVKYTNEDTGINSRMVNQKGSKTIIAIIKPQQNNRN